jgi:hypothetical protein
VGECCSSEMRAASACSGASIVSSALHACHLRTVNTHLSTVNTHLSTVNTHLSTVNTHLSTFNTHVGRVNTHLSTVNTHVGTVNTHLSTVNTHLSTRCGSASGCVHRRASLCSAASHAWQGRVAAAGCVSTT